MADLRTMAKKLEKLNGKLASMQMVDLFNVSRDVKEMCIRDSPCSVRKTATSEQPVKNRPVRFPISNR